MSPQKKIQIKTNPDNATDISMYKASINWSHYVKSVQIRSYFWSVFSCIWTEYEDLRIKSPYSVRIQENTDQKLLRIWTFFHAVLNFQDCD